MSVHNIPTHVYFACSYVVDDDDEAGDGDDAADGVDGAEKKKKKKKKKGFSKNAKHYIFNHVRFRILVHSGKCK